MNDQGTSLFQVFDKALLGYALVSILEIVSLFLKFSFAFYILPSLSVRVFVDIHFVNENYDEGAIIFQAKTNLTEIDTPETVAQKIHQLEYTHFPEVISQVLTSTI